MDNGLLGYDRLTSVLDPEEHLAVKIGYLIFHKIIAAYADSNRRRGKHAMTRLIDSSAEPCPPGSDHGVGVTIQ